MSKRGIIVGVTSFERPKTAQEAVLDELRRRLLDGRLRGGTAIRPDTVGAELGVSAVPVREALRTLEGEGHVSYRPHRGYIVADLDVDDLNEIYRIRELLETEAVRTAMPKLQLADIETLRTLVGEMKAVEDDALALQGVNRRFHFVLFEAAGMPQLVRVLRILWDSSDRYRSQYLLSAENRKLVGHQHHAIMAAIEAGDVDKVIDEKTRHRDHAITTLAAALRDENADKA